MGACIFRCVPPPLFLFLSTRISRSGCGGNAAGSNCIGCAAVPLCTRPSHCNQHASPPTSTKPTHPKESKQQRCTQPHLLPHTPTHILAQGGHVWVHGRRKGTAGGCIRAQHPAGLGPAALEQAQAVLGALSQTPQRVLDGRGGAQAQGGPVGAGHPGHGKGAQQGCGLQALQGGRRGSSGGEPLGEGTIQLGHQGVE